MKRKIIAVLAGLLVLAFIGGSSYYILLSPKQKLVIAIGKTQVQSVEYWNVIKSGLDAGAKEFDISYEYSSPAEESDLALQKELVAQAVARRPDGIILIPSDYEQMRESAQQIIEAKIPLICIDSDVNISEKTLISTNNYEAGRRLGEFLRDRCGGTVLLVSQNAFTSTAIERERGVRDGLGAEHTVLPTIYSNSDKEEAQVRTSEAIRAYPDISCVVGLNEASTVGAATAVKLAEKDVVIAGFDSSNSEVRMLEDGLISVIAIQKPFNMGYLAMKKMTELFGSRKNNEIIYTETELVTKENMYTPENEKLIFMFAE